MLLKACKYLAFLRFLSELLILNLRFFIIIINGCEQKTRWVSCKCNVMLNIANKSLRELKFDNVKCLFFIKWHFFEIF